MPKGMGYRTGGVHAPGSYEEAGGDKYDVTTAGAGMGTTANQPNVKDKAAPGGTGSSGSASSSREK